MPHQYPAEPVISAPTPHGGQRYSGKVCVVTGSTLGIGRAIAFRMAEEGGHVVISSRKQSQVDETVAALQARGLSAIGRVCHQGSSDDRIALIDAAVAKWGRIDVLVLNAAVQPAASLGATLKVPDEMFDKIFDVNVKSFWQFCKEAHPHIQKPGGSILMIASQGGLNPLPPIGLYSISKTAVIGLTKLLAGELGPQGIRVNCLAPGVVRTKFAEMFWKGEDEKTSKLVRMQENTTHLRRLGEPWEQGAAAAFLCSDDAAYVTGEVILSAGGAGVSRL